MRRPRIRDFGIRSDSRAFRVGPGHRVLITGGASGLGRSLAELCSARGARLMLADVQPLDETVALLPPGTEVHTHLCNVADSDSVDALMDETVRALGGIDVLFNNAGVAAAGRLEDSSLEDWEWVRSIDLDGVIYVARAAIPIMRQSTPGWIVNTASLAAFASAPAMGYYNVCKAGVVALSETLYGELEPEGIGVSALCPGFFKTGLTTTFRTTHPGQMKFVEKVMEKSKLSSRDVAEMALKGIERGELYIVPPGMAKQTWYLTRFFPSLARGLMARGFRKSIRKQGSAAT
ncbi:MAG: SDR family NAD(P)-dependent oxidoreductase [Myxococcota bacterium]